MRLVTYNIHKGIGGGDRRYDLNRIIDVLTELNADLVCLQEVTIDLPRTRRHDQAHTLAERFPTMHPFFQQNVHWRVGGYGNLVLSRWPSLEKHRVSLRFGQKKPRGAQVLLLDTPEGAMRLVNWHLGLSERERAWQVARLLQHDSFANLTAQATLIAGDFNDWRNALGRRLLEPLGYEQATAPASRFRSFPAALPVMSLDKVFHQGLIVESIRVVRTKLARRASDHLPVVVEFQFP